MVEDLPYLLAAIVANARRPGGNLPEDFRRQVASADLVQATPQHSPPIQQTTIALQRRRHAHAERQESVFPIRAGECADIPARQALLESHELQVIFDFPEPGD